MRMNKPTFFFLLAGLAVTLAPPVSALAKEKKNDFPTLARAEYIFSCMSAGGTNPLWMEKCACAVDTIASRITYAQYSEAETILTMQLSPTPNAAIFKSTAIAKGPVDRLYRAMAAAELKCFF